jgi:hypothetical protein
VTVAPNDANQPEQCTALRRCMRISSMTIWEMLYLMHVDHRRKEPVLPATSAAVIATRQQQQQQQQQWDRHYARHQPAAVADPGPPA